MTDIFGRQIALATVAGFDRYTSSDGIVVAIPQGTSQTKALGVFASMAPASYVAPVALLSQTMSAQQFGQYMILTAQQSSIARGLQPAQRLTMMSTLAPYAELLNSGDLSGFVAVSGGIPVDGTIITSAVISTFTGAINQYLAGSI